MHVLAVPTRAETVAGTAIVNAAVARYAVGNERGEATSNPDTVIVAEHLDVALVAVAASGLRAATVSNPGNGREVFSAGATRADGTALRLAVDGDDDGRYDPARDAEILDGRTPPLAPGAALTLFVIDAAPGDRVTLGVAAATGSGAPGTALGASGDGGGEAVVGATGAAATLTFAASSAPPPTLAKRQSVRAPDGSASPARGAIVTYTLDARFPADARAVRIDDPIPAGAGYVPDSLQLDGVALSDAADGDAGSFDGVAIHVALGDVPAGSTRSVTFRTRLQ